MKSRSGFFNKATEDSMFSNVIDLLFNCACFIYIGMVIPFSDWNDAATSVNAGVWSASLCKSSPSV
jgi:NhaP-type Na+/H+ or K+/H+ antiporter